MSHTADRNLLLGILAHQNGFISRDALIDAINIWTQNKSQPIEEILVERGDLDPEASEVLSRMSAVLIGLHGGDASRPLGAMSSTGSIQELLTLIPDADLQASLARMPRPDASIATRYPVTDSGIRTRNPGTEESQATGRSKETGPRFRRIKLHARGGLGEVFIAEDGELHRTVALKEIQDRHADHRDSRSRFMVEAEITGGLEHPGIVPVYGLGQYDDGRPFYAMRFIQGDSLADAIKSFHADPTLKTDPGRRTLALQKLLRRFIDVCNAIAYAHSRGVLHRDLKPGNVMVGKYGETLVVDWGLAKILGTKETSPGDESPLMPMSGSGVAATFGVVGTPAYMPPEQAEGKMDELGPASDVYSLGATLYHLLTNRSPVQAKSVDEIIDRVKRGDFPAPRSIASEISKALEAICLKAMSTKSEDRYPTPLALAADIEHWLADEPVSVLAEPFTARLARWTRRHRSAAMAGLVSLVIIAVTATVAFLVVNQARLAEIAANKKTTEAFKSAKSTIDEFVNVVREDDRLRDDPALRPFRVALIEKALTYTFGFIDKYKGERLLSDELGSAYFDAGTLQSEIGRKVEARRAFEESLLIRERLAKERPDDASQIALAETHNDLGIQQMRTGLTEAAERSYSRTVELYEPLFKRNPEAEILANGLANTHTNLGVLQNGAGRTEDARRNYKRAIELREALVKRKPEAVSYVDGLGRTYVNLGSLQSSEGRTADAEQSYSRAIELYTPILKGNPGSVQFGGGLALCLNNRGNLRRNDGRLDKAEHDLALAIKLYELIYKYNPEVIDITHGLARSSSSLGSLQADLGRVNDAERNFTRANELYESLVKGNPEDTEYADGLALTFTNLGSLHGNEGRIEDADRNFTRAGELYESLLKRTPDAIDVAIRLARIYSNLGRSQSDRGRIEGAERDYHRAIELYESLVGRNPEAVDPANGLADTLINFGAMQGNNGRIEDAERRFGQAIKLYESLIERNPQSTEFVNGLARTLLNLGPVQISAGRTEVAERSLIRAIELYEPLVKRNPEAVNSAEGLALSLSKLGSLQVRTRRFEEADRGFSRAIELFEPLVKRLPTDTIFRNDLVRILNQRARLQSRLGRTEAAENSYARSIDVYEDLMKISVGNASVELGLADTLFDLSLLQSESGRTEAAERSSTRACEHYESLYKRTPENADFVEGLARALGWLGALQSRLGRTEAADVGLARALEQYETLVKRAPDDAGYGEALALTLTNLGNRRNQAGLNEAALAYCLRARGLRESILKRDPTRIDVRDGLARTCAILGMVRMALSQGDEAIAAFKEAISHQRQALAEAPGNLAYQDFLRVCYTKSAAAHRKFGTSKEAAALSRDCRALCRGNPSELFDRACEFTLCIAGAPSVDRVTYADEAIDTLREAVRAGWSDFQHTANDPDLAPLRDRTDFRAILLDMMDLGFPTDPFAFDAPAQSP